MKRLALGIFAALIAMVGFKQFSEKISPVNSSVQVADASESNSGNGSRG